MDKFIITQKELNYIETLYTYASIENFYSIFFPKEYLCYGELAYHNCINYYHDNVLVFAEFLNEAKGRLWYRTENYRIGIMDYELAQKLINTLLKYNMILIICTIKILI